MFVKMCVCRMTAGSRACRNLSGYVTKIFHPKGSSLRISRRNFEGHVPFLEVLPDLFGIKHEIIHLRVRKMI